MPGATNTVEKIWSSIVEVQKTLKESEVKEQSLHKKTAQTTTACIQDSNKIYQKIGKLFIETNKTQLACQREQEKLERVRAVSYTHLTLPTKA